MIALDDEQAQKIFEALSIGYENTCLKRCPSKWRGNKQPHSDVCRKVQTARSLLMDLGSYTDMQASGGIADAP